MGVIVSKLWVGECVCVCVYVWLYGAGYFQADAFFSEMK